MIKSYNELFRYFCNLGLIGHLLLFSVPELAVLILNMSYVCTYVFILLSRLFMHRVIVMDWNETPVVAKY